MAENKLADLSTEFAVKILNLTDAIKGHYLATQVRLQVRANKYTQATVGLQIQSFSEVVYEIGFYEIPRREAQGGNVQL